ncbi:MAG: hypothetical protein PHH51_00030 [Bacilli bacterium]|nr:hypothetical protein [Bacilli bacterium]MDD3895508.1 hypothetical protein [Bacilli bacterium]MDD4407562.1 hypothetical protein [Bacilli bacterium]
MLVKINEYRGVIIFYLLLLLMLFAMSYQANITDMQSNNIIIKTNN